MAQAMAMGKKDVPIYEKFKYPYAEQLFKCWAGVICLIRHFVH